MFDDFLTSNLMVQLGQCIQKSYRLISVREDMLRTFGSNVGFSFKRKSTKTCFFGSNTFKSSIKFIKHIQFLLVKFDVSYMTLNFTLSADDHRF